MAKTYVFRRPTLAPQVNRRQREGGSAVAAAGRVAAWEGAVDRAPGWLRSRKPGPARQRIARLTRHGYVAGQVQSGLRAETGTALDTASAVAVGSAAIVEAGNASDVRSGSALLAVMAIETAAVVEVSGANAGLAVTVGESGSLDETAVVAAAAGSSASDAAAASDGSSSALIASQGVLELADAAQLSIASALVPVARDEGADAIEVTDRTLSVGDGCDELATADEACSAVEVLTGVTAEAGAVGEQLSADLVRYAQALESMSIEDAGDRSAVLVGYSAESASAGDVLDGAGDGGAQAEEGAGISDLTEAGRLFGAASSVVEGADTSDSSAGSLVYFGDDPQEQCAGVDAVDAVWHAGGALVDSAVASEASSAVSWLMAEEAEPGAALDNGVAVTAMVTAHMEAESAADLAAAVSTVIADYSDSGGAVDMASAVTMAAGPVIELGPSADTSDSVLVQAAACGEGANAADDAIGLPLRFAFGDESTPVSDSQGAQAAFASATLDVLSAGEAAVASAIEGTGCGEAASAGESTLGGLLAAVSMGEAVQAIDQVDRGGLIDAGVDEHVSMADLVAGEAIVTLGEMVMAVETSLADVPYDPNVHAYNTATVVFERRRARVEYTSPHVHHD
ncbi:MAG: hypothetical protein U1E60_00345 [Reyranellaceae bacterium]